MISQIGMYFRKFSCQKVPLSFSNRAARPPGMPPVAGGAVASKPVLRSQHSPASFAVAKVRSLMTALKPTSPLGTLLRACQNDAERRAFAEQAGTTVNYLYALAGCHRGQRGPSAALAIGIEDASRDFHWRTKGRIPVVSVREIATMCAVAGLQDAG